MHVGWFRNPSVKRIFLNAVGAGIAGGVGVDDPRCVHGDDAVVGVPQIALRHLNLVGIDAFQDAFDQQRHVVSQDGGEGLIGAVHAICFAGFSGDVTPRYGGRAGPVRVR